MFRQFCFRTYREATLRGKNLLQYELILIFKTILQDFRHPGGGEQKGTKVVFLSIEMAEKYGVCPYTIKYSDSLSLLEMLTQLKTRGGRVPGGCTVPCDFTSF